MQRTLVAGVLLATLLEGAPVVTGITNAASYATGRVAPGEIVTIFGTGMGPQTLVRAKLGSDGRLTTTLAGTQVLVDGLPAPMVYTSATQASAIVPYSASGKAGVRFEVAYEAERSLPVTITVVAADPGIFTVDSSGRGPAAMADMSPAAPGSIITFYITGEGLLDPPGADGALATAPNRFRLTPAVRIGGRIATVQYAGSSPGSVFGLGQINAIVPDGLAPGNQPLAVEVGGLTSPTGATVAVGRVPGEMTTVFVIHGLGQDKGAVEGLVGSLTGPLGLDKSRFVVDGGFDFGECTEARLICPAGCSITAGSRKLAEYIARRAPTGRIALVGFSLGGLLAREVIATRLIDPGRVETLETLGTPSLGYPYAGVDALGFCPALIEGMNGNWRVWQDRNEVQLSPYLEEMRSAWNQGGFPGGTARWLAAAGRSCSNAIRALSPSTGCRDANPSSDGVICEDSATYQGTAPAPVKPTDFWRDPERQYVHTTSGGGLFAGTVLCSNSGRNPTLVDPPPGGSLFAAIRDVLEGRPVRPAGLPRDVLALTAEQQAAYVRDAVERGPEGDDGLIRLLLNRSDVAVPELVHVIRQARTRTEAETAAELIAVAGNETAREALRQLDAENPDWFGKFLLRLAEHRRFFEGRPQQ